MDADVGEVLEKVDLLHLWGGEHGLGLLFVAEHFGNRYKRVG